VNFLPKWKIDALASAFARGFSISLTSRETKVSHVTVIKYFRRFRAEGLPRPVGAPVRQKAGLPPHYRGPEWIGKAIDG
jgi:hypothetical protein